MPAFCIILLTFNEERNLGACLDSLQGLDAPLFVVDSFSTDGTLAMLDQRGVPYVQHVFENYARQRNWAQEVCPFNTPWVMHLDAGERLTPELVRWLQTEFHPESAVDGYMFSRRTHFLGRWIRYGGHYPNYHLRLFRRTHGRCEDKAYDQHFVCDGVTQHLPPGIDIIDTVCDTLYQFTQSHARWALYEAIETVGGQMQQGEVEARLGGTPIEQKRWLKQRVFQRSPLFVRALLYYLYRYLLRGGFRDGAPGLIFHFLQGFWFRFLIDANVWELRRAVRESGQSLGDVVRERYKF